MHLQNVGLPAQLPPLIWDMGPEDNLQSCRALDRAGNLAKHICAVAAPSGTSAQMALDSMHVKIHCCASGDRVHPSIGRQRSRLVKGVVASYGCIMIFDIAAAGREEN